MSLQRVLLISMFIELAKIAQPSSLSAPSVITTSLLLSKSCVLIVLWTTSFKMLMENTLIVSKTSALCSDQKENAQNARLERS